MRQVRVWLILQRTVGIYTYMDFNTLQWLRIMVIIKLPRYIWNSIKAINKR